MNRNWSAMNTNHAGQQGRGRECHQLGRETFIDQIIVRARESSGPRSTTHREARSQWPRIQHFLPHLELSKLSVSEESEMKQSLGNNLEHIKDQGSIVQPIIEYHLFGQWVTQEEWEWYNAEQCPREADEKTKGIWKEKKEFSKSMKEKMRKLFPPWISLLGSLLGITLWRTFHYRSWSGQWRPWWVPIWIWHSL